MVKYIHIEGMDLAGKSTASKAIFEMLGSDTMLRHNTIQSKSQFHSIVDKLRLSGNSNPQDLGILYHQVLKDDLERFIYPTQNTIQDSTVLLRSLAWYEASQNFELVNLFLSLMPKHPVFTHSILLTASIEVRQKRLQMRINEAPETVANDDMMVLENPELFMAMEKALIKHSSRNFNSTIIDTSDLTKDEVKRIVIEMIF